MLSALMETVDNMHEQTRTRNRVMETPLKNQKEMLEIKNIVTEMKNGVDKLFSRWDMVKERINELKYMSVETSKHEM